MYIKPRHRAFRSSTRRSSQLAPEYSLLLKTRKKNFHCKFKKNSNHPFAWSQKRCVVKSSQNCFDTWYKNCMFKSAGSCLCQQTALTRYKLKTSLLCRLQAGADPSWCISTNRRKLHFLQNSHISWTSTLTLMSFEIHNLLKLPNIVYFMSGSTISNH